MDNYSVEFDRRDNKLVAFAKRFENNNSISIYLREINLIIMNLKREADSTVPIDEGRIGRPLLQASEDLFYTPGYISKLPRRLSRGVHRLVSLYVAKALSRYGPNARENISGFEGFDIGQFPEVKSHVALFPLLTPLLTLQS